MHASITAMPHQTQLPQTLEKLANGEFGCVMAINVDGELKKRFFALGLKEGARVRVLRKAKFGGPVKKLQGLPVQGFRRRPPAKWCS